jgi:hypothetical protein
VKKIAAVIVDTFADTSPTLLAIRCGDRQAVFLRIRAADQRSVRLSQHIQPAIFFPESELLGFAERIIIPGPR